MTLIFTKRFFRLSDADQASVVKAIINDIESCIGVTSMPETIGRRSDVCFAFVRKLRNAEFVLINKNKRRSSNEQC